MSRQAVTLSTQIKTANIEQNNLLILLASRRVTSVVSNLIDSRRAEEILFLESEDIDLNQFVVDHLQLTDEFKAECNQATDALANYLKQQFNQSIAEVVKV